MATVYIKEQGSSIIKNGERICVSKNGQKLLDVPVFQIENLVVIGHVQVTTQALHMLMHSGVDISYMTYAGQYLGHTCAEGSGNIFLRFEQYQLYLDEARRLAFAKAITENKIRNQIALVRGHRWTGETYDWHADIKAMEGCRSTLHEKKTSNEILGVEGICSNVYFRSFGKMLHGDFPFEGRNRRPPKDPVNVILSLTYTFLTREVCSALDADAFEAYLGFLHGIRYGRKSLALDLVEEFRQPAGDRLVLMLFNKRMINADDFEFPEGGGVNLSEDGFKKFCTEYERWMNGRNTASGNPSFRSQIRKQVAQLRKSIIEKTIYEPYAWKPEDGRQKMEDRRQVGHNP